MDNKDYQNYQSSLRTLLNQAIVEALKRSEAQSKTWKDYKKAHEKVKKGLEILPQELTTNCMVPIGRKALMKGKLVHTNEILVCLGEGYFAKYSAKQAIALCDRRIKQADEMLINLEKEKNLLEMRQSLPIDYGVFGDEERKEIIETYDEKEEKEWRIKHRQREKEYRQKLAQLRGQEKTQIQSEEDLWQRLDELELQEELEDEIDRLHEDDCNYYGEDNQDNDNSYEEEDGDFSEDETTDDMIQERLAKLKHSQMPKDQKDSFEKENMDKEADQGSSSTYDIANPDQPSSSTSLDTNTFVIESSRETIKQIELKDSVPSSSDEKSLNNKRGNNSDTKSIEQDSVQYILSQNSETSVSSSEGGSTYVKESDSVQSSSQSEESDVQKSTRLESQSRQNMEKLLSVLTESERDEFFGQNRSANENKISKSESQKRRVSFTDTIQVNVFEKFTHRSFDKPLKRERESSSSESDLENEIEKSEIIEEMISAGVDLTSNDEETEEDFTEIRDDEDDLIRIEFKHSKRRPKKPVRSSGNDEIETPADIHRIFYKPKSILKKSSSETINSQSITPPADDVFDQETDEPHFGSSYTIIVKDVEERKPELPDVSVSSSSTRPPSKFRLARAGIKQ